VVPKNLFLDRVYFVISRDGIKMKTIYIVCGETGEHDDYWVDWDVMAFTKREDADTYAKLLQEQADNWVKIKAEKCWNMGYTEYREIQKTIVFLDEQFQCDGETYYNVFELGLRNKL
jgi:hypothetical protein